MSSGLVSVIIPTHNRARLASEAVASVKAQSWPHVQIIVADDGSDDGTEQLLGRRADVEYCRQERRGQGAARNLGLRIARGEYLASLDSDDLWEPSFLEESLHGLRDSRADFVFSNWVERAAGGPPLTSAWERSGRWKRYYESDGRAFSQLSPEAARELYLTYCPSPSSALLLRRSIVSEWCEHARIADDWILMMDAVFSRACRGAFTMRPLWTKRADGTNIYHGRVDLETLEALHVHDARLMARRLAGRMSVKERLRLRTQRATDLLGIATVAARRDSRYGRAARHLVDSACLHPGPLLQRASDWLLRRLVDSAEPAVNQPRRAPADRR